MQKIKKSIQENTISDFPKLPAPAFRALRNAGLFQLDDLTMISKAELKNLHGVGPKTIQELAKALSKKGLSFQEQ